jgi:hypothetical protein
MTIAELINKVRFVTDADGNRQAILLDLAVWEEILALLEDLEADEALTEEMEDEALNRAMDEAMNSPLLTQEQALAYLDQD